MSETASPIPPPTEADQMLDLAFLHDVLSLLLSCSPGAVATRNALALVRRCHAAEAERDRLKEHLAGIRYALTGG